MTKHIMYQKNMMLRALCIGAVSLWAASARAQTATTTAPATAAPAAAAPVAPGAPAAAAVPVAPAAAPTSPVSTPSMAGPLTVNLKPESFDIPDFGKIYVSGAVTGLALTEDYAFPGDRKELADVSNAQVFIQKVDGVFQFFIQAGVYSLPALGAPYLTAGNATNDFYGPLPQAFIKIAPNSSFSIEAGKLPTLMGAEYTFTFENMNIERGLLWNQENAVNRGIQVNQTMGKFTASLSWNDGFYSNRYSWLSGSLTYANGPHSLAFVGMGNLGQTAFQTLATPVQNNSSMYAVIYTYTKGSWIIQPYWQYTNVPTNAKIGVVKGNTTQGGAILVNHTFKHGFSLPVRWEYIASSGNKTDPDVVNLMYGPGSKGTSITVTPTFQYGGFFFRGDISYVHVSDITPGLACGQGGNLRSQPRAMAEIGFIFGNNIIAKKP